jgi:hypothetical protein
MAPVNEVLQKAQFVMDAEGHATAAVLDIQTWEALLEWLEDFEDVHLARERLQTWTTKQGWTRWEEIDKDA